MTELISTEDITRAISALHISNLTKLAPQQVVPKGVPCVEVVDTDEADKAVILYLTGMREDYPVSGEEFWVSAPPSHTPDSPFVSPSFAHILDSSMYRVPYNSIIPANTYFVEEIVSKDRVDFNEYRTGAGWDIRVWDPSWRIWVLHKDAPKLVDGAEAS